MCRLLFPCERKKLLRSFFSILIGDGRNGGLVIAALDDFYIIVWTWKVYFSFLPDPGHKKSREPFKDSLLFAIKLTADTADI